MSDFLYGFVNANIVFIWLDGLQETRCLEFQHFHVMYFLDIGLDVLDTHNIAKIRVALLVSMHLPKNNCAAARSRC